MVGREEGWVRDAGGRGSACHIPWWWHAAGSYLFGATLNQKEMNTQVAEAHFNLLVEALRHIDRNVRVG
jgi:hypothetical protein